MDFSKSPRSLDSSVDFTCSQRIWQDGSLLSCVSLLHVIRITDEKHATGRFFSFWLEGVDNKEVIQFVRGIIGCASAEMWQRCDREIEKAYTREGNPLQALAALSSPVPVLHLCVPAPQPQAWIAQEEFAVSHPWFEPHRLSARSHFPMLEIPEEIARLIEAFVAT